MKIKNKKFTSVKNKQIKTKNMFLNHRYFLTTMIILSTLFNAIFIISLSNNFNKWINFTDGFGAIVSSITIFYLSAKKSDIDYKIDINEYITKLDNNKKRSTYIIAGLLMAAQIIMLFFMYILILNL